MSFLWHAQLERNPPSFPLCRAGVSHMGHLHGDTPGEESCCLYSTHNAGLYIRAEAVIQADTCDSLWKVNKKKSCAAAGVHRGVKLTKKPLVKFVDKPSMDFNSEISHVHLTNYWQTVFIQLGLNFPFPFHFSDHRLLWKTPEGAHKIWRISCWRNPQ